MSVDKFKFVSPGVFIDEIDESGIPELPERMGPLIIGRFQKGPAHRPVKVNSFREFASIFGNPSAGTATGDIWRSGEQTAPTYAAYAAQAWLRNNSPCTIYRVLGQNHSDAVTSAKAGWKTDNGPAPASANHGGAFGLFLYPNPDSYSGGTQATIDLTSTVGAFAHSSGFTINVPTSIGGEDGDVTILFGDGAGTGAENRIRIRRDAGGIAEKTAANLAQSLVFAINGTTPSGATPEEDGTYVAADVGFATSGRGASGVAGVTASRSGATVTITADQGGLTGNQIVLTDSSATPITTAAGASPASPVDGIGHSVTGTLAAIWYVDTGSVVLSGTARDGAAKQGAGVMIKSADSSPTFLAKVLNGAGAVQEEKKFNFDRDSKYFIRKVFNTDPTQTNTAIVNSDGASAAKAYWLGETFESNTTKLGTENGKLAVSGATPSGNDVLGVILQLDSDNLADWHDRQQAAKAAATGWFISQDTRGSLSTSFNPTSHTEKLFKVHALGGSGANVDPGCGESSSRDIKISIEGIKVPSDNFNKWATFSLVVRRASDHDARPQVLERFSNLNLNPSSANFVRRVIGDRSYSYSELDKLVTENGEYENNSKHIRIECSPYVDAGSAEGLVPFGVYGPSVPKTFNITSGSTTSSFALGSGSLPNGTLVDNHLSSDMVFAASAFTASIVFPTPRLRSSSKDGGLAFRSRAYFGYQSSIKGAKRFDMSNLDMLRGQPVDHDPHAVEADESQWSWVFTLDDVQVDSVDSEHNMWVSGSRASGDSYTSKAGGTITGALENGADKFTSPMFGGFDGYDITEKDPLRNSFMSDTTAKNNYAHYSLRKAIDMTSDAEYVEFDVATMPGVTNDSLNSALVEACESRADALAIIDLEGNYQPPHEHKEVPNSTNVAGSVTSVVNNLKALNINSSYGCTFYPFVRIRDTINDAVLYVPPSVVALGTFSSSQRKSAVWFAPAGFTRGGLSEGSAGLPVIGVKERVTSANRDKLYDANINPIATFPAEGVVIFGQKTMQVTQSALDRINVRRLLIYLKKEISRIASKILFDQNVQATWDRFTGQVVPFLEGVKAGLGLTDFKVVLDDTTTTPDLIDRNILYAKIFLKPARAIEFIALDFIVTRSGASFDD